jgi:ATP synthase protein I
MPIPDDKDDAALSARLDRLKTEIQREKAEAEAPRMKTAVEFDSATTSGMAAGMRVVSELVAGVLVGGLIGYGLDYWLGTKPWLLLLCLLLGSAAGFNNVYRLGRKSTTGGGELKR